MRGSTKGASPINVQAVASAGSTQSDATSVSANASPAFLAVSGGDDVKGIRLPSAAEGKMFLIKNLGTGGLTGTLNVYPASGDAINALAVNSPLVMASLKSATFVAVDSTTWYTVPLLPS